MIKISILSIGDEICIGQIINSNAQWIAQKCVELGCKVGTHLTAEDSKSSIIDALNYLSAKSDYVLITGGLGPTHDDITKKVMAEYFDDKLVFNAEAYRQVELFFAKRGREVTEINKEQALLPSSCTLIKNEVGTAPGMMFERGSVCYVSMPGVPLEMKTMMQNFVLEHIRQKIIATRANIAAYKVLNTIGIPESDLADLIGDVSNFLQDDDSLAFLPSVRGVKLRIGTAAANINIANEKMSKIENYIKSKAGKYIYSDGDITIAEAILKVIKDKGLTVSVAESCTGGLLGAEFTSVSGASSFFKGGTIVYSNLAKIEQLQVNSETLEKFGAVSEETAMEMASNVRSIFATDIGISITGIAGPDGGTAEKPVGTVWIGFAYNGEVFARKFNFGGDRTINRERAVFSALNILYEHIYEANS